MRYVKEAEKVSLWPFILIFITAFAASVISMVMALFIAA